MNRKEITFKKIIENKVIRKNILRRIQWIHSQKLQKPVYKWSVLNSEMFSTLIDYKYYDEFFKYFGDHDNLLKFFNVRGIKIHRNFMAIAESFVRAGRLDLLLQFIDRLSTVYPQQDLRSLYLNKGQALEFAVRYGRMEIIKFIVETFQPVSCHYHYQNKILEIIAKLEDQKLALEIFNYLEPSLKGGLYSFARALEYDRLELFLRMESISPLTTFNNSVLEIQEGSTLNVIKHLHNTGRDHLYLSNLSIRSIFENNRLDILEYLIGNNIIPNGLVLRIESHLRKSSMIMEQALPLLYRNNIELVINVRDIMRSATVNLMKWLHKEFDAAVSFKFNWSPSVMNMAAEYGNLAVVEWLHRCRLEGCTKSAIDSAAEEGFIHIVEFLHENRTEGCSDTAMDYAAKNNHLFMLEWLHKNRQEGCSRHAIARSVENGHYDVVEWLTKVLHKKATFESLKVATTKSFNDIVIYLIDYNFVGENVDYILLAREATGFHNLELIQYFIGKFMENNTANSDNIGSVFLSACRRNSLSIMQYFIDNHLSVIKSIPYKEISQVMFESIDYDCLKVIKIIDQHFNILSQDIIEFMFKRQPILLSHFPGGPVLQKDQFCNSVDLNIVKYFVENRSDFKLDTSCVIRAIRDKRFNIASWLLKNQPEMFTFKDLASHIPDFNENDDPSVAINSLDSLHLDCFKGYVRDPNRSKK